MNDVHLLYHQGELVGHINEQDGGYYLWLWWPEQRDRMGLYSTFNEAMAMYNLIVSATNEEK